VRPAAWATPLSGPPRIGPPVRGRRPDHPRQLWTQPHRGTGWAWYKGGPVRALDRALYTLLAAGVTLFVARRFYGYMLVQTGGEWSAPLDDVFIHFDYARATARGYPFQWSEGNGFSSGNTSLLYPFVLAAGYLAGFTAQSLMIWAGLVACCSVFGLLLVLPRLFASFEPASKYIAPLALFSIGALDWSLFSGMEVALFLGIWGGALRAYVAVEDAAGRDETIAESRFTAAARRWELGAWGALLVLTRPEGATSIAVLGIGAAHAVLLSRGRRAAVEVLARAALPSLLALSLQTALNRLFTGEVAANGAIVKLTVYNPFLTPREKLDEYLFLLKYVVFRNVEYHFTDVAPYGWITPALAALPLFASRTRKVALMLWASIGGWLLIVALNAQVRWQNERYTMPAVAWLLVLAALGLALLVELRGLAREPWSVAGWLARAVPASLALALFLRHQEPRMRDQIWFFGRACRNIRDQHLTAGRVLRKLPQRPKRVMVGDAGAILYASDLPGLDLIGLGGFHDLPFARAGVHGLGATLELLEHLPPAERPDTMAIYPSWWGDLPGWFGRRLVAVPVRGNVICGGAEKVIYETDWHVLGTGTLPRSLGPGERIADEVDVADLVSERRHDYRFPHPSAGFVDAKILPDPRNRQKDLFDAGRRIPEGRAESFKMRLAATRKTRLLARSAPEHKTTVEVTVDGKHIGRLELSPVDGWAEAAIDLPPLETERDVQITLTPISGGDWVDHHLWAVEAP
jgi:hypothetical protein